MAILRFWRELLILALVIGVLAYRSEVIGKRAALKAAAKELSAASEAIKASEAARQQEAASAKAANAIAEQYEKDKRDAEAAGKRTADDLRAGNLRLRAQWQGCEARRVPASTGAASEPDAAADDRAESAGRIVRAASEADAQIRALQNFIRDAYLDSDAKAVLARYLKDGMVAVMFVWDADSRARYFGPPMRPDQLETLLSEAAKNFAPEVTGTLQ